MDEVDPRLKSWISTSFDEDAKSFSVWYEDDENLQIFACLEDKVVILDMFWDDGLLMENNSLVIKSLNSCEPSPASLPVGSDFAVGAAGAG